MSLHPPIGGLLNVFKPRGWSSFHIVGHMRKLTGIKRIGHAGTLDPFAEGVLPILIGRSTRLLSYMDEDVKQYRVVLVPGNDTTTQDLVGEVVRSASPDYQWVEALSIDNYSMVRESLQSVLGTSQQLTPLYSAVKVDGRPLYDYARKGVEPPRRPIREITVTQAELKRGFVAEDLTVGLSDEQLHEIEDVLAGEAPGGERGAFGRLDIVQSEELPRPRIALVIDFSVSKGTYIRTLCETLGEQWGTGAYAYRLQRLAVGDLISSEAALPESLLTARQMIENDSMVTELSTWLAPWWHGPEGAVSSLAVLELDGHEAIRMIQGQRLALDLSEARIQAIYPASAGGDKPAIIVGAYTAGRFIGTVKLQSLQDGILSCTAERMIAASEDL